MADCRVWDIVLNSSSSESCDKNLIKLLERLAVPDRNRLVVDTTYFECFQKEKYEENKKLQSRAYTAAIKSANRDASWQSREITLKRVADAKRKLQRALQAITKRLEEETRPLGLESTDNVLLYCIRHRLWSTFTVLLGATEDAALDLDKICSTADGLGYGKELDEALASVFLLEDFAPEPDRRALDVHGPPVPEEDDSCHWQPETSAEVHAMLVNPPCIDDPRELVPGRIYRTSPGFASFSLKPMGADQGAIRHCGVFVGWTSASKIGQEEEEVWIHMNSIFPHIRIRRDIGRTNFAGRDRKVYEYRLLERGTPMYSEAQSVKRALAYYAESQAKRVQIRYRTTSTCDSFCVLIRTGLYKSMTTLLLEKFRIPLAPQLQRLSDFVRRGQDTIRAKTWKKYERQGIVLGQKQLDDRVMAHIEPLPPPKKSKSRKSILKKKETTHEPESTSSSVTISLLTVGVIAIGAAFLLYRSSSKTTTPASTKPT